MTGRFDEASVVLEEAIGKAEASPRPTPARATLVPPARAPTHRRRRMAP